MPQIVVFPNSRLRQFQPVFHAMPFVIGIAEAIRLFTARTLHGLFVREGVGNYGFDKVGAGFL